LVSETAHSVGYLRAKIAIMLGSLAVTGVCLYAVAVLSLPCRRHLQPLETNIMMTSLFASSVHKTWRNTFPSPFISFKETITIQYS